MLQIISTNGCLMLLGITLVKVEFHTTHSIEDNKTVSDPFYVINSQVTKKFKTYDVYLGGENLLNYKQENPILGGDDPFGSNFDASIIWAPVMGRLIYTGIRLKIN